LLSAVALTLGVGADCEPFALEGTVLAGIEAGEEAVALLIDPLAFTEAEAGTPAVAFTDLFTALSALTVALVTAE